MMSMDPIGPGPHDLRESVTHSVQLWLVGEDEEGEGFAVRRYGRSEAKELVRRAESLSDAMLALRDWFADRLTVDPGVPGPFGGLAYDLISGAMDLVRWDQVAHSIREDEEARPPLLEFGVFAWGPESEGPSDEEAAPLLASTFTPRDAISVAANLVCQTEFLLRHANVRTDLVNDLGKIRTELIGSLL
jgi:hypothetical protein